MSTANSPWSGDTCLIDRTVPAPLQLLSMQSDFANRCVACYDRCRFASSMHPVHIEPAEPDDHEWCACLMASSEPWITLQRDLSACRQVIKRPSTELFIAWDRNSQKLGFILLAPYGLAGSPYIASIAVSPDAQGQTVGSQLMQFTEQHFHDRSHLFLLVSSFNSRAQHFYRRHGYEFIGELKDYIVAGHSELIFHKSLP
jgi:[ribosomal protein S18]-alanine N-acetyltransferase